MNRKQKRKTLRPRLFSSDGQLELRVSQVILHGKLAIEVSEVSARTGLPLRRVFVEAVRLGLAALRTPHKKPTPPEK